MRPKFGAAYGLGASSMATTRRRVWDLKRPAVQPVLLRGHEGPIRALGFAPDGRLVTAGFDEITILYGISMCFGSSARQRSLLDGT